MFSDEFKNIVSDLYVLVSHKELAEFIESIENKESEGLEYEFYVFSKSKTSYDQVRLLDSKGMEVIRVNRNGGSTVLVEKSNLQFKGDRYYYEDTYSLKKGQVFVSPFDLNIEGDEIEKPFKPMIRFGMPFFNNRGEKKGIVILNYLGEKLLSKLDKHTHLSNLEGYNMLVNSDGYFLKGMKSEDEWGFMFPERKNRTFANVFSNVWNEINSGLSGQMLNDYGLFTYDTLYPLTEGLKSSSGSSESFGESVKSLDADKYYWKVISFIPVEKINILTRQLRYVLLVFNLFFIVLLGISIWFLTKAIINRQIAEEKIKYLAHYDTLTGLPNRSMLFDRMKIALAVAKRTNIPVYVFFIDLDGFKKINDDLGHEAGDYVLVEVSKRLNECVREMDTVARMGGDEFVLVIVSEKEVENIKMIANRIIESLSRPISYKSKSCHIGSSIGIAAYPENGDTMEAVLRKADEIMYEVKNSGKNNFKII